MINTRELNKIHLRHLQVHHATKERQSPSCNCALWQRYLRKFDEDAKLHQLNSKSESQESYAFIRSCPYAFNAHFVADMLSQSAQFAGKSQLLIHSHPMCKIFELGMTHSVSFNGFELKGEKFDFVDAFASDFSKYDEWISSSKSDKYVVSAPREHAAKFDRRLPSRQFEDSLAQQIGLRFVP